MTCSVLSRHVLQCICFSFCNSFEVSVQNSFLLCSMNKMSKTCHTYSGMFKRSATQLPFYQHAGPMHADAYAGDRTSLFLTLINMTKHWPGPLLQKSLIQITKCFQKLTASEKNSCLKTFTACVTFLFLIANQWRLKRLSGPDMVNLRGNEAALNIKGIQCYFTGFVLATSLTH